MLKCVCKQWNFQQENDAERIPQICLPWRSSRLYDSHDCHSPSWRKTRTVPHQNTESCGLGTAWPVSRGSDSKPTEVHSLISINLQTCKLIRS